MSYENVPCASPDTERDEEPAPSLYGADTNEDSIQFAKKTIEQAPSRLAETANIEDHLIMNEEEIAQASRINRKEFESEGRVKREDESQDNLRHGLDGNSAYMSTNMQPPRVRWMNMSMHRWAEYNNEKQSSENSNPAEVPNCEFSERGNSVIIKRSPEVEPSLEQRDSRGKIALDKEEYVSLQCHENITRDEGQSEARKDADRSRGYYYYYNTHEDLKSRTAKMMKGREEFESDTRMPETKDMQKPQDPRVVPQVYHMQYPNVMALSQAGAMVGPQGIASIPPHILREHLMRARYPAQQRGSDYATSRLEQQVPVASSPGDSAEQSTGYGSIPRHAQPVNTGIQYIDRQGLVQQGFAVIPGIGPVQVSVDGNGLYYSAIPVGPTDSSHYENYTAAAQAFVGAKQAEPQSAQLQRTHMQHGGSTSEMTAQQSQEKALNVTKSYQSSHQNAVSPKSGTAEECKGPASPAVNSNSNSSSPAPPSIDDTADKKQHLSVKPKGRPKPYGSRPEIKCEQCGKIFGSSSALAKHKLTHSDERRYVCTICSKGFKRQDHLNGHMVTHRDKKPYECSYADCDKSYCDMRSLRRHLENHHTTNQASGGSGNGSRTASPALSHTEKPTGNTISAVTVVPAVGHADTAGSRVVLKPGRGRPPKDRSKHEGDDSGSSTPGNSTEPTQVRDQATLVKSRERNSDSCSSSGSEELVMQPKQSASTEEDAKTHTAIDMLKLAAERVQEQREKHATVERLQQQPYMVFPEGMYPQQWYAAQVYPGQDPRFGMYPYQQMFAAQMYNGQQGVIVDGQNFQRQQLANQLYAEGEGQSDLAKQKAAAQMQTNHVQPSPRHEYPPQSQDVNAAFYRSQVNNNNNNSKTGSGTPTNATAIALATAKDSGQPLYTRESYYGVNPSGTLWQPVRYDEGAHKQGPTDGISMGNVKSTYNHVRSPDSNTSSDTEEKFPRGVHFAAGVERFDIPGRKSGMAPEGHTRTDMNNYGNIEAGSPMEDRKIHHDNNKNSSVFRNPGEVVTARRKRPKPEPLKIPPSVSTAFHHNLPLSPHGKRPVSPPYTPPPMLSPRSIFSHVNAAGNLTPRSGAPPMPMTPSRLLLSSRSCRSSVDGDDELSFPEPKINVGPQFQAVIPDVVAPEEQAKHDVHKATLCWYPMEERKKGKREEIESFLDMACSVAVVGGSSNKEYALHILHRARGNMKEAVKLLLSKKNITQSGDPMHNYRYEGSVKWLARERQTFRNSFRTKGKVFHDLRKEIGDSKTVSDCVEFYYLWKANHPEAVRGRTRYIDSDSEDDYEDDTGSETNSNPSLFECDFPQCNAKFVSRQALNGHIRVHGGSFMKPSEPRKRRPPVSSHDLDDVVIKRRKPHVPAPPPEPLVEGGPLPEFACKVCGRIFHKIKSRSAHMKTHVKRPDDDDKHHIHGH